MELTSQEGINHTFVVEEAGDEVVAAADPGQTDTGTIELDAGSYTFYCDVPGHREARMEGTLEVR
ncbi:MAG TPA: plastocyanin/azurin family copper-binding protein [Actinomycetota bacterium]